MSDLSEIIENMKTVTDRQHQDQIDAKRYRYLRDQAVLRDPYDATGSGPSSWNWTIELATGKSKGCVPPADTPSFDETVDKEMCA